MKKLNKILLSGGLLVPTAVAPVIMSSCSMNKAGSFAFMFKTTGNHYGEVLYSGFSGYMSKASKKHYDKSPSEANVGEQIQMIETLILQNVKALTISAAGTTGYDSVLQKANERGIKTISVDSPISPKYRLVHVDHCDPNDVGRWLAYASILISIKEPYPYTEMGGDNANLDTLHGYVKEKCQKQTLTKKKRFGFISSTADSPSQNEWMDKTIQCLHNSDFTNVVDPEKPEIKYGNDEPTASKAQAEAYISQNAIDVMICPTTVAMLSAGQALSQHKESHIKMTGLGMPSEMKQYMPTAEYVKSDPQKAFDFPCPYMTMWNVKMFGELAAFVVDQATKSENPYTGHVEDVLPEYKGSDGLTYNLKTIVNQKEYDDGYRRHDGTAPTKIVSLKPLSLCADNIEKYYWL